jgi:hypothetical protein
VSVSAIVVAAAVVVVGSVGGLIAGWIDKPAWFTGSVAASLFIVSVAALAILTLVQSGAFKHSAPQAAPPSQATSLRPSEGKTPRAKHSTQAPPMATDTTQPPASHPAATQPGEPEQTNATSSAPKVDVAAESLSAGESPERVANNGQDISETITVTGATPGGKLTWEEDIRASGSSYPGPYKCLISSPTGWCGVDLHNGSMTANSAGVATFDVTFIPGQAYDAVKASNIDDFNGSVWEVDVWDDATLEASGNAAANRTSGCAPAITTPSSALPPAQWSRS